MKGLEQVRSIHYMMSGNERTALRNYLQCFESRKKGHKPQSVILLDLIEKYDDDGKVLLLLKKKVAKEDARRMVIGRLRDKMLSSLLLDVNLERGETYDEHAQARAKVSKGKIQAQLLIARGQRNVGFYVLDRAIQVAKQYELYDDLVEMLGVKRQHIKNWDKNYADHHRSNEELQNYAACRDSVDLAKMYHQEIMAKYGFRGLSRVKPAAEQVEFLTVRRDELLAAFDKTSSATVGFYSYFLSVELYQIQGQLKEASVQLNSWAQMIENNPSIKKRERLATVYANIGANELWMYSYKEAATFFEKSISYLRENSRNHALISEYLFYAQFYSLLLKDAGTTIETLINNKRLEQAEFRKALRNYLLACVAFAKGDLKKVPHYLMDSHAMDKDKQGWNIGSR
ncbi:MAG: hypothetical protein JKX84_06015, partial [Flavobacteriales bacterium]|nr:hypothetical protein [Flavobacteriales bacterium]